MTLARQKHAEIGQLLKKGQLRQAAQAADSLIKNYPDYAKGWAVASQVAYRMGSVSKGEKMARRAVDLEPLDLSLKAHLANCLVKSKKFSEACNIATELEAEKHLDPPYLDIIGTIYSDCQKHKKAEAAFERAVEQAPDNANFLFNLAAVQRFNGKTEEAEGTFGRVIDINPQHWEAIHTVSNLCKQTPENNHTDKLEKLLEKGQQDWRGEVMLRYALGKEYEDIELWDNCFAQYELAGKIKRQHTKYDINSETSTIDEIIRLHTRGSLSRGEEGITTPDPIFILGLPRTGTTLVERILSSHSEVCSLGELSDFASALMECANNKYGPQKISRSQLVSHSTELNFSDLGRSYVDKVDRIPRGSARFIDKMPLNFLYVGLICKALPKAKIIHLNRHPMDACFAIFKNLFKSPYPWSYDLEELSSYYIAYHKLMAHWRESFPGRIHDVSYESLVADQKEVTTDLLEFCDLDWQNQCLDFYKSSEASTTASAVQVRQPIYSSSVGKWQRFESQLSGLRNKLITAHILSN